MDELIAFWTARLNEAEAIARASGGDGPQGQWARNEDEAGTGYGHLYDGTGEVVVYDEGSPGDSEFDHIAANDPASVLADIAADRALIALLAQAEREDDYDVSRVLREVASIRAARYSSHPQWQARWTE